MRWRGVALVLLAVFGSPIPASAVDYGTFPGAGFQWIDVADQNGLFGPPIASPLSNNIEHAPSTFEAECPLNPACAGGGGLVNVDDTLTYEIATTTAPRVDDFALRISGDTTLQSAVGASAASSIFVNLLLEVVEIDGLSVNALQQIFPMVFAPVLGSSGQGGAFESFDEGYGTYAFDGTVTTDLDALLASNGASGNVTRLRVQLDVQLTAFAESGATSRIELSGYERTVIPEPSTALLLGLGLGILARRRA